MATPDVMKPNVDPDMLRRWREAVPPGGVLVLLSDETCGSLGPTPEEFERRSDELWAFIQDDLNRR